MVHFQVPEASAAKAATDSRQAATKAAHERRRVFIILLGLNRSADAPTGKSLRAFAVHRARAGIGNAAVRDGMGA